MLVNVLLPKVLITFVGYLNVATGNVEEIENLIPDLISWVFIDQQDLIQVNDEI